MKQEVRENSRSTLDIFKGKQQIGGGAFCNARSEEGIAQMPTGREPSPLATPEGNLVAGQIVKDK